MNFKKFLREHREAFTLAEVVIVMAILSIMMVAFAPVVTKKTTTTGDAFRTFMRSNDQSAIYYGTISGHKGVYIGHNSNPYGSNIFYPKLTLMQNAAIDSSDNRTLAPAVAFLTQDSTSTYYGGQLLVAKDGTNTNGTVILGGANNSYTQYPYTTANNIAEKNLTIIGGNACDSIDDQSNVICIGAGAPGESINNNSIYIGSRAAGTTYTELYFGNVDIKALNENYMAMSASIDNLSSQLAALQNQVNNSSRVKLNDNIKLASLNEDVIPSDERLKNVGKPFTEGLEVLDKINPVNFTYKRDENKFPHVGVIAQALKPIFPNAVQENKEGYLYIRTEDMFYAAINAIKELHQYFLGHDKRIQQLEARNAVLEQQNKELQELYTELAKRVERLDKKKTKNVNLTPMPDFEKEQAVETKEPAEEVKTEE